MKSTISPRLLSEKDAARYIGMSRSFLAKSRMNGTLGKHTPAPPWVQCGRTIRYAISDLDQWIDDNRQHPRGVI